MCRVLSLLSALLILAGCAAQELEPIVFKEYLVTPHALRVVAEVEVQKRMAENTSAHAGQISLFVFGYEAALAALDAELAATPNVQVLGGTHIGVEIRASANFPEEARKHPVLKNLIGQVVENE